MKTMTIKKKPLLLEAHDIINGERQKMYGHPANGLRRIAQQWNLYLDQKYGLDMQLTAQDVCWMMSDLKKARAMHAGTRDNILDAAGYIGLIEKVL
jgi:hypothetical protein